MKIGIAGSEAAKFTELGQARAKYAIIEAMSFLAPNSDDAVVSGHCHLGGIDIWAEEVADSLGYKKEIYPPADLTWSGGFKPRNLQIARNSDIVYCITVDKLPEGYKGMVFDGCYHCLKANAGFKEPHIKSGGCWTVLQGIKMGKVGKWVVVNND